MLLMSVSKIQNVTLSHQFKFNFHGNFHGPFHGNSVLKLASKRGSINTSIMFFIIKLFLKTALKLGLRTNIYKLSKCWTMRYHHWALKGSLHLVKLNFRQLQGPLMKVLAVLNNADNIYMNNSVLNYDWSILKHHSLSIYIELSVCMQVCTFPMHFKGLDWFWYNREL